MLDWIIQGLLLLFGLWCAIYFVVWLVKSGVKLFKGEIDKSQLKELYGILIFFVFLAGIYFISDYLNKGPIENGDSNNLEEWPRYYVNISPANNLDKSYRVPAVVSDDDDGYHILVLYWSNGRDTTFFDTERNEVEKDEETVVEDDEGRVWVATLTTMKAKEE